MAVIGMKTIPETTQLRLCAARTTLIMVHLEMGNGLHGGQNCLYAINISTLQRTVHSVVCGPCHDDISIPHPWHFHQLTNWKCAAILAIRLQMEAQLFSPQPRQPTQQLTDGLESATSVRGFRSLAATINTEIIMKMKGCVLPHLFGFLSRTPNLLRLLRHIPVPVTSQQEEDDTNV